MKTQNANWLVTGLNGDVYLRYFCVMDAVSTLATWQVSALQKLGSLNLVSQSGFGYAIR